MWRYRYSCLPRHLSVAGTESPARNLGTKLIAHLNEKLTRSAGERRRRSPSCHSRPDASLVFVNLVGLVYVSVNKYFIFTLSNGALSCQNVPCRVHTQTKPKRIGRIDSANQREKKKQSGAHRRLILGEASGDARTSMPYIFHVITLPLSSHSRRQDRMAWHGLAITLWK